MPENKGHGIIESAGARKEVKEERAEESCNKCYIRWRTFVLRNMEKRHKGRERKGRRLSKEVSAARSMRQGGKVGEGSKASSRRDGTEEEYMGNRKRDVAGWTKSRRVGHESG